MKQLTQSEFKKGARNYENIASPQQDAEHEQIKFMAVDEFGNLQYSQDGVNFETIQSDGKVKPLTSLTPITSESELPEGNEGDAYAVLTNGNLPLIYFVYTTEWENRGQFVDNTLVYYNNLLYIYNESFNGYFAKTSYTDTAELTNGANFVNSTQLQGVQDQVTTNANNIADIQANYVTTNTDQTITGVKTFKGTPIAKQITLVNNVDSPTGNRMTIQNDNGYNGKIRFGAHGIMMTGGGSQVGPDQDNSSSLGGASCRWLNAYISNNLSDGTNSITIADIANKNNVGFPIIPTPSSTTLTDNEKNAIKAGGVVKGNINGLGNFQNYVFFPAGDLFSGYYMGFVVVSRNGYSKLYQYAISDSTNLITFYGNKNIDIDSASNISITGLNNINGKTLPAYPSNTGSFIFKSVDGALVWNTDNYLTTDTDQTITAEKTFDYGNRASFEVANGNKYGLSGNQYNYLQVDYNGVGMYSFGTQQIFPNSNNSKDLGTSGLKWRNFFVQGNLSDGTNNVSVQDIANAQTDITDIESKIPAQASSSNQLADKDFVNSSINAFAAYYITKNAQGDPFATKAELNNATTFYSGGSVRVPTTNDYCIVLADESQQSSTGVDPTTRYTYQGNQWEFQYKINDTPLTAAQLSALNSGINSTLVGQISTNQTNISSLSTDKADKTYVDGNFVSVNAQTLTDEQKAQARANIGAGSSNATTVLVNGVAQTNIRFNSDPQTQINGKQDTIDSSHKLSADLTEDGTTNKVFTATEKTKLNGIESGAEVNDLTDVQVDNTSVVDNKIAKFSTINGDYDASTNPLATQSDIPNVSLTTTSGSESITVGSSSLNFGANAFNNTPIPTTYVSSVNGSSGALTGIVDTTSSQTLSNKTVAGLKNTGDYKIGSSNSTIASVSGTNLTLGNSSLATDIAGSGTRPTYNSNSLALYNDIPTTYVSSIDGQSGAITGIQTTSNLVTSISSSSTDTQYPSAKCVYDLVGDIDTLLTALNSGSGV